MEKVETGRKNEKIILAIVIVAIILISQIAIILANTGVFNNNGEKFISLLTEKQYLCSMAKKNLDNFSGDGEKKYKFSLQNSTLTKVQNFLGVSKYKLLNGKVEVEGTVVTEDKNYDVKMSLNNISLILIKDSFFFQMMTPMQSLIFLTMASKKSKN